MAALCLEDRQSQRPRLQYRFTTKYFKHPVHGRLKIYQDATNGLYFVFIRGKREYWSILNKV